MHFNSIYFRNFLTQYYFFRCTIFEELIFWFWGRVYAINLQIIPHWATCSTIVAISLIAIHLGLLFISDLFVGNRNFLFFLALEEWVLVPSRNFGLQFLHDYCLDWVWEVYFLLFCPWRGLVWSPVRFWVQAKVDYLNYFWVHQGWWY